MKLPYLTLISLGWLVFGSPCHALTLPHVFGDHMVLQRGQPVPVWGWVQPGEAVSVTFAGQTKRATGTSPDGRWEVQLDPLAASTEGRDLIVQGAETVTYHDVLVGEVWLCSGQSNMQKPVGAWRGQPVMTIDGEKEIAAANYPLIRLMNIEITNADRPARDFSVTTRPNPDYPWMGWVPCSPASLDQVKFSAAGYFFARKIFQELNVPVGVIEATAGGTHIEAWTPVEGFATDPALAEFATAAQTPKTKFHGTTICTLYNGMIYPLIPLALRGVLWYQGESNLIEKDGAIYANKMAALIKSWRAAWGRDFSFYYVQLPPLLYSARAGFTEFPLAEPVFREAQAEAMKLPGTGMVVTTDVGDLKNMHPPHKKEVGERLARWALALDYGRKDIEPSGPIYRSIEREGFKAVLHFDHVDGGLVSQDGQPLTCFTTAGVDGKFFPAAANISGDAVVITCPEVKEPKEVRFAFDETANSNFFNKAGLPAVPFRTDRLPISAGPMTGAATPDVNGPVPSPSR